MKNLNPLFEHIALKKQYAEFAKNKIWTMNNRSELAAKLKQARASLPAEKYASFAQKFTPKAAAVARNEDVFSKVLVNSNGGLQKKWTHLGAKLRHPTKWHVWHDA